MSARIGAVSPQALGRQFTPGLGFEFEHGKIWFVHRVGPRWIVWGGAVVGHSPLRVWHKAGACALPPEQSPNNRRSPWDERTDCWSLASGVTHLLSAQGSACARWLDCVRSCVVRRGSQRGSQRGSRIDGHPGRDREWERPLRAQATPRLGARIPYGMSRPVWTSQRRKRRWASSRSSKWSPPCR